MAKSEAKQKFANSFLIAKMGNRHNNHSTQITRFISFSYAQQRKPQSKFLISF